MNLTKRTDIPKESIKPIVFKIEDDLFVGRFEPNWSKRNPKHRFIDETYKWVFANIEWWADLNELLN